MVASAAKVRFKSLRLALTTLPGGLDWLRCAGIFGVFVALSTAVGAATGFLRFELMSGSTKFFVLLPILIFIRPAMVEEIVFRGLLFPHRDEPVSRGRVIIAGAISLAIFVAMHPLNGIFVRHEAYVAFTSPIFLSLAAALGLACMIAYRISGSLWPPILMHWITVLIWTMFLGGKKLLTGA